MKLKYIKALIWLALCFTMVATTFLEEKWIKVEGGKWDPSPKMISDVKTKIEPYVETQAKAKNIELQKWETYTFQYQGQEEKGIKYIIINALCNQAIKNGDLSKGIIHVFDGGSCYFNVKYDPDRREFFDLFINGEA